MERSPNPVPAWRKTVLAIIAAIVAGAALMIIINHIPPRWQKLYADPLKAVVVLMVGAVVSTLLERYVFALAKQKMSGRRLTWVRFFIRLVLYVAVILAVLAAFGVGLSSVVFGGAFLTVIIGIAGQSMFGNLIAGMALVIFHPFEVGDRIVFVAWQYPLLMPSFPHESLKPGYAGTVSDISLMYTTLLTDDGVPLVVPNGIMIQAAVENHARTAVRRVRMRFDVDLAVDPDLFLPEAQKQLQGLGENTRLAVVDMAPATYSVAITLDISQKRDDEVKNDVFRRLIPLVKTLKSGLVAAHRSRERS